MATFHLRVEGVNLSSFLFDCQDLSTVRGGSLLLLDAVERVSRRPELQRISCGASVGLFSLEAPSEQDARAVRDAVRDSLATDSQLRHATFVVDVVPASGGDGFAHDRERLLAANRWRQMRQPSFSLAGLFDAPDDKDGDRKECDIDLVRPAARHNRQSPVGKQDVSESVFVRRTFGREAKQTLYERETGVENLKYVGDLEELTKRPPLSDVPAHLDRKMAVIYLDGNRFGELQHERCRTAEDQRAWNEHILGTRRRLLKRLVTSAGSDPLWRAGGSRRIGDSEDGALRLETLLWGGDELTWVVPAWKGFETLALFFDEARSWRIPKELDPAEPPLTHGGGVVFCSCKSPIHRVVDLAHGLADVAKQASRDENRVAIEVLESFDHVGSAEAALLRRAPLEPVDARKPETQQRVDRLKRMTLKGEDVRTLLDAGRMVKGSATDFPRRRHHELATGFLGGASTEPDSRLDKEARQVADKMREHMGPLWDRLAASLGGGRSFWTQLWHFWDYLSPETGRNGGTHP